MKDVLLIIGSVSDRPAVAPALELLAEQGMTGEVVVLSAHRDLRRLVEFLDREERNYRVVIAAAGLSAALPGVVASLVKLPVIGVPLAVGGLAGIDAALSMLQLPRGVPVATMGIGAQGMLNAVLLAQRMIRVPRQAREGRRGTPAAGAPRTGGSRPRR